MSRDWLDPRFPDKPDSALGLALMALVAFSIHAALVWGALEMVLGAID